MNINLKGTLKRPCLRLIGSDQDADAFFNRRCISGLISIRELFVSHSAADALCALKDKSLWTL